MKFLALLFLLPVLVIAEDTPSPCRPLLNIMMDIELSFRHIGKNLNRPDQREQVLDSISQMFDFFQEARGCPPRSIENLAEPARTERVAEFVRMIDEVKELILGLKEAVFAGNKEGTKNFIQKLKEKRKEGHILFD